MCKSNNKTNCFNCWNDLSSSPDLVSYSLLKVSWRSLYFFFLHRSLSFFLSFVFILSIYRWGYTDLDRWELFKLNNAKKGIRFWIDLADKWWKFSACFKTLRLTFDDKTTDEVEWEDWPKNKNQPTTHTYNFDIWSGWRWEKKSIVSASQLYRSNAVHYHLLGCEYIFYF